jgi:hypothetical protein
MNDAIWRGSMHETRLSSRNRYLVVWPFQQERYYEDDSAAFEKKKCLLLSHHIGKYGTTAGKKIFKWDCDERFYCIYDCAFFDVAPVCALIACHWMWQAMDAYSETLEGLVEWRIHEVLERPLIIMAMKALKKLIAGTS